MRLFIQVKPGAWATSFLNPVAHRANQALYQYSFIDNTIFQIDAYHYDLALRLALYLSIENRINKSGWYRVGNLLKIKYSDQELNQAFNDRKKAYRIRQTWHKSLARLQSLGWQIKASNRTYPNWLRPDWLKSTAPQPEQKELIHSLAHLLAADVQILQPASIVKKLKSIGRGRQITGEQVRKARKAKGWTQQQLAEAIWVSKTTISHIENGKRRLTAALLQDLKRHLDL